MKNNIGWGLGLLLLICIQYSCDENPYHQGRRIYTKLCSNCHMEDGSGLKNMIPAMSQSIPNHSIENIICIVSQGVNADSLGMAMQVMPSFKKQLSDVEFTNLVNFLDYEWNNAQHKAFKVEDVKTFRNKCTKKRLSNQ